MNSIIARLHQDFKRKSAISYNLLNMAYYVRPAAVTPIGAAKSVVDMLVRALHKVRSLHGLEFLVTFYSSSCYLQYLA